MFIFNVKVNGNKLGKALLAILIIIILIVTGIVCYNLFTKSRFKTNDVYNKNVVKNDILDCFNISVDSPYLFHEKKKSSDNPKKDPISWTRLNIYKFVLMISYKVNSTT